MLQRLVLTTTSLHNVVISNDSDVIYYEVVTPKWDRHLTTISRLNPNTREFDVVGELQNENDKPVGVRINAYGDDIKPADDFLKADASQGNQLVFGPFLLVSVLILRRIRSWGFKGKDGRHYVWRTKGRRLEVKSSPFHIVYRCSLLDAAHPRG